MKLTIEVEPDVLKRASLRAVEECTSVSAVLCGRLAAYADGHGSLQQAAGEAARRRIEAIESLIRLSKTSRPVAAPHRTTRDERGKRTWKRDDLYDR